MVGEAIGIGVCLLLWGTRAFLASKYQVKYRAAEGMRRVWKRGTPEWITRAAPWLELAGWVALLATVACWALSILPQ